MKYNRYNRKSTFSGPLFILFVSGLFFGILITSGCSLIKGKKNTLFNAPVLITLHLNALNYYQPGEAVICTARIINITPEERNVQILNAQSLTFWVGTPDMTEVKRVMPVYSPKESMMEFINIPPYQYAERTFVFTKLTETTGTFTLEAIYEGIGRNPDGSSPYKIHSVAQKVYFEVKGERKFNRDRDGILLKQDAIRLVKEIVNKPISIETTRLIIDEAGFLNWEITYSFKDEDGKEVKKAYLVNPYLGVVRHEVPPYVEKKEEEKKPPKPFKPSQPFSKIKAK